MYVPEWKQRRVQLAIARAMYILCMFASRICISVFLHSVCLVASTLLRSYVCTRVWNILQVDDELRCMRVWVCLLCICVLSRCILRSAECKVLFTWKGTECVSQKIQSSRIEATPPVYGAFRVDRIWLVVHIVTCVYSRSFDVRIFLLLSLDNSNWKSKFMFSTEKILLDDFIHDRDCMI